jgi:60S ribosomal subunit assembly/export protein LOC1
MMTILAMVNAEKEGQIESKMMKARQLEEIREAKKAEAEARMKERKNKLEGVKDSIRQKKKGKAGDNKPETTIKDKVFKPKAAKKTVAFA